MSDLNWIYTHNTRDLGDRNLNSENRIKPNRFVRSDFPRIVTDTEKKFLLEHNIKTIIDLRNFETVHQSPNAFMDDPRFSCGIVPLSSVDFHRLESEEDMIKSYIRMIENESAISVIFKTMANTRDGVLFHCEGGKDRTGIIACILQLLAGVPDEVIIQDYLKTNDYLKDIIIKAHRIIPDYLASSRPEYIKSVLDYIRDRYENVENYLFYIGLTEEQIERLKSKLLN